jgi:hypothetical protein
MKKVNGENGATSNGRDSGEDRLKPFELDLDRLVVVQTISAFVGDDGPLYGMLVADVARVAQSVAGENPSPLVRKLAAELAINWLFARLLDLENAGMVDSRRSGTVTVRGLEHIHRVRSRAHRRLMATVRSLAAVRRCERDLGSTRANRAGFGVREPVA